MVIRSKLQDGEQLNDVVYTDSDTFDSLPKEKIRQSYGICFYGDKIVIGYRGKKNTWGLIGGTVERGESPEDALKREIREESNMRVLVCKPVGYQKVVTPDGYNFYQLRYCCLVEPLGEFVSDPDLSITKIALIDPQDYKKYFNWGEMGEHIIKRAVQIRNHLK